MPRSLDRQRHYDKRQRAASDHADDYQGLQGVVFHAVVLSVAVVVVSVFRLSGLTLAHR